MGASINIAELVWGLVQDLFRINESQIVTEIDVFNVLRSSMVIPKMELKVLLINNTAKEIENVIQVLEIWPNIVFTLITRENQKVFCSLRDEYDIVMTGKNCISKDDEKISEILEQLQNIGCLNPSISNIPNRYKGLSEFLEEYNKNKNLGLPENLRHKFSNAVIGSLINKQKYPSDDALRYKPMFINFMNDLILEAESKA